MKHKQFIKPIVLLFVIMSLFSCTAQKQVSEIQHQNASKILEKISLYEGAIKSLKGLAKVKIKTPDNKISYTQVTIAKRPDLLRLEALNPFGKTVGFISSDGNNIYIISPSERATYDSKTTFNLAYIYPGLDLSITSSNLVNLILARLPENIFDLKSNPELSTENGLIKLTFTSNRSSSLNYLWLNGQNSRIEKAEFSLPQGQRAKIKYEYFDSLIDGLYFPQTIDFTTGDLSITIVYETDIDLNQDVNMKLFRPSIETAEFVN